MKTCWPKHQGCQHDEYMQRHITLDGKPAIIRKDPDGYPVVTGLAEPFPCWETAWTVVFNVVDNRGAKFSTTGEHGI